MISMMDRLLHINLWGSHGRVTASDLGRLELLWLMVLVPENARVYILSVALPP